MAHKLPDWLNEQFLSTCLQGEENSEGIIEVLKFTTGPVVPEGNNYGSCIMRVNLDFKKVNEGTKQTLSLIIKSPVEDCMLAEMLEPIQDVESKFYCQFIPIAKQLGNHYFAPKCYFSPNPSIIIMEDLKQQGYVMKDRCSHLDFDHCRLYAITSATFHAVSIAAHKINAELVESLGKEKLFSDGLKITETYKIIMDQAIECTSDFMEKIKFKIHAKLVRAAKSYLITDVIQAHKPSGRINSLSQADPWIPNMMFKYDDLGKVSGIKLLDFQALRYGSPINDLVFFLWCSANHDVRENRMHDIFHLYCDSLNNKLQELKCSESLSYSDLLSEVQVLKPLILFIVLTFLPLQVYPSSFNISDLLSKETDQNGQAVNKMAKYFTESYCNNTLARYLEQLDCMGVFEYLEKHA